jgi:hypothetical protein
MPQASAELCSRWEGDDDEAILHLGSLDDLSKIAR